MLLRSRFLRNWSFLALSGIVCQLLGILATIRIARALTPEGYGQYNLVQTLAGLGVVLAGLGLRQVVIRECARHPERSADIFHTSAILRALALAAAGAGILIYSQIGTQGLSIAFGAVVLGMLVGRSTFDLVEGVVFGHERMGYSTGINLVGSTVWVVAAWSVPDTWLTPFNVSLAFALLEGGKGLVYSLLARKAGFVRFNPSPWATQGRSMQRFLLSQSLPLYWLALLTAATNELPIVFLAGRSGQAEVGLYNAGSKLISPMLLVIMTALAALYPGLSLAGVADGSRFLRTIRLSLLSISLFGAAGATTISFLRQELVLLLFGPAYQLTADAMAFQCWFTVLMAIYSLIGTTLAARDRQKWLAFLSSVYTVLSLPILWFGAGYGATGLATAILLGAILNLPYHWAAFQRSLPQPLSTPFALAVLLILGTGMILGWAVPQTWPWSTRALLAVLVSAGYFSVVVQLRPLTGTPRTGLVS